MSKWWVLCLWHVEVVGVVSVSCRSSGCCVCAMQGVLQSSVYIRLCVLQSPIDVCVCVCERESESVCVLQSPIDMRQCVQHALQHTATRTATHCNTLCVLQSPTDVRQCVLRRPDSVMQAHAATRTATHCNTLCVTKIGALYW